MQPVPPPPDHQALSNLLGQFGQQHLMNFYHRLSSPEKLELDRQIASLDWPLVHQLVQSVVLKPQAWKIPADLSPPTVYPYVPNDAAQQQKYRKAFARGEDLLRQGKIAAFVVAGGQGTRLGWDGPKGTFPATPVRQKPLFQCFAEFLMALAKRYGRSIPLYVMTSPINHAATVSFWESHQYFHLNPQQVMFFPQDMLPAIGFDGKALLETPASLALSPNGHGGSLLALHKSGALTDMRRRGIEQISYFQVDNPIVRCIDPLFIGLHDLDEAQMSSKMLPKAFGKEKLGNFCLVNGKLTVIEYSDLPDSLAEQRLPNGELRFRAGSIALHAMRRDFVESLNDHGFALPYHRAEKKVPCIDPISGQSIKPDQPNAVKMETFVFDALPLTARSIIYETSRGDEFAPIKAPTGIDSVVSSREITNIRNVAWLAAAGVEIPRRTDGTPDCIIEIAPSFALYPQDVLDRKSDIPPISAGDQVYLE